MNVEAAIVGGGPAGLSAALVLGRCRRRVVLIDGGAHRNDAARAVHGFLGHDGIAPAALRALGREQLRPYPTVELRDGIVTGARRTPDGFALEIGGEELRCRVLLLATGLVDSIPPVDGATALVGSLLHHCPYCDSWELRDRPLAVYAGAGRDAAAYASTIRRWSRDLVVLTDGRAAGAELAGFAVDERRLARLAPDGDRLRIELTAGPPLLRRAMFFHVGCRPRSDLAEKLGCRFDAHGGVVVDRHEATGVPGLYVAGDASRDVLLSVVAAGEGASAGVSMDRALG